METDELIELIIVEIVSVFLIGLTLKGVGRALSFSFAYLLIFFLPGLPVYKRFDDLLSRYVFTNFLGLIIVPITYYVIGRFVIPISRVLFVVIPIVIFGVNLYLNKDLILKKPKHKKV